LAKIRDSGGRRFEAILVAAAERYVQATDSLLPPFGLALVAASDPALCKRLLSYEG
jgi:hypothetical protein